MRQDLSRHEAAGRGTTGATEAIKGTAACATLSHKGVRAHGGPAASFCDKIVALRQVVEIPTCRMPTRLKPTPAKGHASVGELWAWDEQRRRLGCETRLRGTAAIRRVALFSGWPRTRGTINTRQAASGSALSILQYATRGRRSISSVRQAVQNSRRCRLYL